jgi:hypothetical protein
VYGVDYRRYSEMLRTPCVLCYVYTVTMCTMIVLTRFVRAVCYLSDQVAYEIGLSEAIAVYSGVNDIVQAATVYGDTAWGLGSSVNEQVSKTR